jgi:hypothetical protein
MDNAITAKDETRWYPFSYEKFKSQNLAAGIKFMFSWKLLSAMHLSRAFQFNCNAHSNVK